jgi:hypothetical protein
MSIKGDRTAFFKAMEMVRDKARQGMDVNQGDLRTIQWSDSQDIAEE